MNHSASTLLPNVRAPVVHMLRQAVRLNPDGPARKGLTRA